MVQERYSLKELCSAANVTERTVRFYIKEGLLPPPEGSGPFSRYGPEHRLRLLLIRRLKAEFLPLSEIKSLLDSQPLAELQKLAQQPDGVRADLSASQGSQIRLESLLQPSNSPATTSLRRRLTGTPASLTPQQQVISKKSGPPVLHENFISYNSADVAAEEDLESFNFDGPTFDLDQSNAEETGHPAGQLYLKSRQSEPDQSELEKSSQSISEISASTEVSPGPVRPAAAPLPFDQGISPLSAGSDAWASASFSPMAAYSPAAGKVSRPTSKSHFRVTHEQQASPVELPSGTTWERLNIAPGIELHVESELADERRSELAEILAFARRRLGLNGK